MEKDYKKIYEDALERARIEYKNEQSKGNIWVCEYLSTIFPELLESDDKKCINWLIDHLKGYINQTDNKYAEVCKKAIDWLEKQKCNKTIKFSEEDEKTRLWIIHVLCECGYKFNDNGERENAFELLEKIKQIIRSGSFENQGDVIALIQEASEKSYTEGMRIERKRWLEKQDKELPVDWNEKIKGLDDLETYILSLDSNRSLDAIKVDAKNIRFLVNKDENKYDKGYNDGFSASEYNRKMTEEDIRHIENIIGCLEEFLNPDFPIYKDGVFKEIKWLENLKTTNNHE